jgi:hypothetical protein
MTAGVAAAAVAFSLLPLPAWANAGIGFLIPSVPALIVALLPVIFVEAPVLSAILRLPLASGLKLSASVNVRSTLIGALIAFAADIGLMTLAGGSSGPVPGRASLLLALVPMFLVTLWIEDRAVARNCPQQPRTRVALATLAANTLSYAALAAAIVLTPFFKAYDQMGYRDHVYVASSAANRWKEGVEKHWQSHKRFPERAGDLGLASGEERKGVRGVTLEPAGRIVLELGFPSDPELDGKRLVYEPRVVEGVLQWKCRAPGLAPKYAPYGCRDQDSRP